MSPLFLLFYVHSFTECYYVRSVRITQSTRVLYVAPRKACGMTDQSVRFARSNGAAWPGTTGSSYLVYRRHHEASPTSIPHLVFSSWVTRVFRWLQVSLMERVRIVAERWLKSLRPSLRL